MNSSRSGTIASLFFWKRANRAFLHSLSTLLFVTTLKPSFKLSSSIWSLVCWEAAFLSSHSLRSFRYAVWSFIFLDQP